MHYDYKQKLNKVDGQKNRNFQVPEIDWKLNEAFNIFIKANASPKYNQLLGFETSQRSIDNIRPLVIDNFELSISALQSVQYVATLPTDYMMHLSSNGLCKKNDCTRLIRTNTIKHDDKEDIFHSSSFEWEDLYMKFSSSGLLFKTDGTFTIEKVYLDYIRLPKYIHNAVDYIGGTYVLPDGTVLTGYQECELPVDTYSEIVDLAVLITTGDLLSSYQIKQSKTQITN